MKDEEMLQEEPQEEQKFASLADLCEGARFIDQYFPQIDATIRYSTYVPLDELLKLQARFNMMGGRGRRDSQGFLVAVLEKVLVKPRIQTPEDKRLLLKGNAAVLLDILGNVLGTQEESFKAVVEDLGPNP